MKDLISIAQDGIMGERDILYLTDISKAFDDVAFAVSEFRIFAERNGITWN